MCRRLRLRLRDLRRTRRRRGMLLHGQGRGMRRQLRLRLRDLRELAPSPKIEGLV